MTRKAETKNSQLQIRISSEQKALLSKQARKAGLGISEWALSKLLPPHADQLQNLINQLKKTTEERFALAELNDFLTKLSPQEFEQATQREPDLNKIDLFHLNYIAAMIEYTSKLKSTLAPKWLTKIPILNQPHFASDLKNIRLHLLLNSPIPFRRRNIFIDASVGDRV